MIRFASLAVLAAACSRSQGAADEELGGLVVTASITSSAPAPGIDVDRAAKDPAELARALTQPYRRTIAAIGPHELTITMHTTGDENGNPVADLAGRPKLTE